MPKELIVILLGAAPISEIRGAILAGVFLFDFTPIKAYLLGTFGNVIPIPFIFLVLERFSGYLMHRYYFCNRFLAWLFEHTRRRHGDHFHYWKWAPLALFIFVAIPLPFTGAWSGVVAAFVFGIPFWRAFFAISAGVLVAGIIVLGLVSLGLFAFR